MHSTGSNPIALLMQFGPDPIASRTIWTGIESIVSREGNPTALELRAWTRTNRPYELAADSNALTMQFELGANSWLMDRITNAGFRDSGPPGGQLLQTWIRARRPIPDPMAGFDRFGLRLQSDYSRLKIVIDQQRFCNRFSKIEPAVELFLRPRPRSDGHGHGNFEFFSF